MNAYTDKYVDYNDGLMYENYFGGVVAMTVEHFKQVSRGFIFYYFTSREFKNQKKTMSTLMHPFNYR